LDEAPIAGMPPERRDIGVVFQNYALFPHMSVFENVAFPLKMRRMAKATVREKVQAALDLVRLSGLGARLPRQLSGGQQQRVALARALVFSPRLLLMDEPLGALDKNLREQMQFELKRLHGDLGVTVVYVTHDQEEALTMSNRVALMNGGRIEQLGTAEELYERPRNRFVAEFIGESTMLEGRLEDGGNGRGGWFVSAAGPRLPAAEPDEVAAGVPCLLVLRPEKIALAPAESHGARGIAGEVEELIYVGDFTRYRVRGEGGLRFTVKVPNSRRSFRAREGTAVRLSWEPDDACIVPLQRAEHPSPNGA
ncbi:MAG: ABC transporter ATP-binding protein, partial [Geminicoccales bacterium]